MRPSIQKARDNFKAKLFRDGEAPLWSTPVEELSSLGVGVVLHFQVLRYLAIFFAIASVLMVPVLLLGVSGGRLATVPMAVNVDALRVSMLSIANIGLPAAPNGTIVDDALLRPWGALSSFAYSHRAASVIITICDVLAILLFFAFCAFGGALALLPTLMDSHTPVRAAVFLRMRISDVSRSIRASTLNASDYAVFVTGLPAHATEEEVSTAAQWPSAATAASARYWHRSGATSPRSTTSALPTGRSDQGSSAAAGRGERCASDGSSRPLWRHR